MLIPKTKFKKFQKTSYMLIVIYGHPTLYPKHYKKRFLFKIQNPPNSQNARINPSWSKFFTNGTSKLQTKIYTDVACTMVYSFKF